MDAEIKKYQIVNSSGEKEEFTEQELYEFYLLWDHGLTDSFDKFKKKVDSGQTICADDKTLDWWTGQVVQKGVLKIKKIQEMPPPVTKEMIKGQNCSHKNKYVNEAGGVKFWFCKDCKSDLGDA